MNVKSPILFVVIVLCIQVVLIAGERVVVRIPAAGDAQYSRYQNQGYDIAGYRPAEYLDLVVPKSEYPSILKQFPQAIITQTEEEIKSNLRSTDRDIPGYRSYQTMIDQLNSFVAQYSNIIQLFYLGSTWGSQYSAQGHASYNASQHSVWAVKISDNPNLEEDEPNIFFCGLHHAREPLTVEVCMEIIQDLLENYGTDPWVTQMVNQAQIWIVPMLNPDGHRVVYTQQDIWWRKNIRDNNNNHQFDTFNSYGYGLDGVDLNRNYGHNWGYISATDDFVSPIHHGPNSFSEPETLILKDFLETRHFLAGISFHTYGEYILFPYGYVRNLYAPDELELSALAVQMAILIPSQTGGNYAPGPSWGLYPASGTFEDWAYGSMGIFAYCMELATEFIPPAATVNLISQRVKPVARKLMDRMNKSILTGRITNALNNNPVSATVYIQGIDDSPIYRAPYKSNITFGSYYRFLPAGNWNVTIHKEGFLPYQTQVTISSTQPTVLDIQLTPSQSFTLHGIILSLGEVPVQGVKVEFPGTDIPEVYTDTAGFFNIPDFYPGYYIIRLSKSGYETIVSRQTILSEYIGFLLYNSAELTCNFENGISAWTVTGTWNATNTQAYTGNYSLTDSPTSNYGNYSDTYARLTQPLALNGLQNASLALHVKCAIALDGDYCTLEVSTNGSFWRTLDYYNGTFDWTEKVYNLNAYLGGNLYIRFHLVTNDDGTAQGIYIDNLRFYGNPQITNPSEPNIPIPLISLSAAPNPFRNRLNISVTLDKNAQSADLGVYNLKGQKVASLLRNSLIKGNNSVIWNASNDDGNPLASGLYILKLNLDGKAVRTRKVMLLK